MTPGTLYTVEAEFEYRFTNADGSPADADVSSMDTALNQTTSQLYLLGVHDVGLAVDHSSHRFWMTVGYRDDEDQFVDKVFSRTWSTMRTAFHAAGISTPGWPKSSEAGIFVKIRSSNIAERASTDDPLIGA